MTQPIRYLLGVVALLVVAGCGSESSDLTDPSTNGNDDDAAACTPNPSDPSQFVIVGFWSTTDCSGDPIATNAFPVTNENGCYCWPGNSGQNSADTFSCDAPNNSFTYTQYNSLTCGQGDDTPTIKTVFTDQCRQDIPPTLYSRIIDYTACGP